MSSTQEVINLGSTNIQVSTLGTGTWAWGDGLFWGYGRGFSEQDVQEAFDSSLLNGINFFDTAEVYAQGRSEAFLGGFLREAQSRPVVATKFFPYPWRLRRRSLIKALRGSLRRLGLETVDLYQIHWPFPPVAIEIWAEALAEAVQQGLARAVGVSNYNEEQMRRAHRALAKHGIPLATNQVEYSLFNRRAETSGLLIACQELGVTLIAYSPLAQGVLSGKYTPDKAPPGIRGQRYSRAVLGQIAPLIRLQRDLGRSYGGRSASQVALNWLICKGTLPIPGAKNARQAHDNAGAMGWRLSPEDVSALDRAAGQIGR